MSIHLAHISARTRRTGLAILVAALLAAAGTAMSAAGGRPSRSRCTTHSTSRRPMRSSRVHTGDRHPRARRKRRRGRAHRADRAGGQPLARRRLLHRELELAPAARRPAPAGQVCGGTLAASRDATAHPTASGSASPPASACSSTTPRPSRRPRCRDRSWVLQIDAGRASSSSRPPKRISGRSSARSPAEGAPATLAWLKRSKPTPGEKPLPDNETSSATSPGHHRPRPDQPLLLLPLAGRARQAGGCTRRSPTSRPAILATSRTSPAPGSSRPPS